MKGSNFHRIIAWIQIQQNRLKCSFSIFIGHFLPGKLDKVAKRKWHIQWLKQIWIEENQTSCSLSLLQKNLADALVLDAWFQYL